jgi:hypothetical protein
MAFTTTVVRRGNVFRCIIVETLIRDTSEATITGVNGLKASIGRIFRQAGVLIVGTGTTIDPILGRTTNPTGLAVIVENGTPAGTIDNAGEAPYFATEVDADGPTLYHRSNVNSVVADHSVTTEYIILAEIN